MFATTSYSLPVMSAHQAIRTFCGFGCHIWVHEVAMTPDFLLEEIPDVIDAGEVNPANTKFHAEDFGTRDPRTVRIYSIHTEGSAHYVEHSLIEHVTGFVGGNIRELALTGKVSVIPTHLSTIPRMIANGDIDLDVVIIQVSTPDSHGNCSLGLSVACTRSVLDKAISQKESLDPNAMKIIAVVNPNVPRTSGNSMIHTSYFDAVVLSNRILPQHTPKQPSEKDVTIARIIAEKIHDGTTLQLGIGKPSAVLMAITTRKGLGIYSEMCDDFVMHLYNAGAITGPIKTSFVMGSQAFYDWIELHPDLIEFYGTEVMNDEYIIAQHDNFVSINCAMGVVASSGKIYVKDRYSGQGGQADTARGAIRSKGGFSVIEFHAEVEKHGTCTSTITTELPEDMMVSLSEHTVDYIATEYGMVKLSGRTKEQRILLSIAIAHPRYWESLLAYAKSHQIFYDPSLATIEKIQEIRAGYVTTGHEQEAVV